MTSTSSIMLHNTSANGNITVGYKLALVATSTCTSLATRANGSSEEPLVKQPWLQATFISLYAMIFFIGLFGNFLVMHVVLRNKHMQTITNLFITNLALSDIIMCLLAVPFTPLSAFMDSWVFGEVLCHIVPMILAVSVYVSTLTSTAIAIDRFSVIIHPFKPRMKASVCLLLIVVIWLISISISMPIGVYHQLQNGSVCKEVWPTSSSQQVFTVTSLVLQYIVPCAVITFCYTNVSLALQRRSTMKIGNGLKNKEKEEIELRRKRRTNKMLIAMVGIFVCCWLPLNIVLFVTDAQTTFSKWKYFTVVFFVAHVIAMSSTCYNPFLYAWMNDSFRKEFNNVMPCLFRFLPKKADSSASTARRTLGVSKQQPSVSCKMNETELVSVARLRVGPATETAESTRLQQPSASDT